MTDFIQVFTTVDDEAKARELARALVGSWLVGCAQVLGYQQPISPKWNGNLARGVGTERLYGEVDGLWAR